MMRTRVPGILTIAALTVLVSCTEPLIPSASLRSDTNLTSAMTLVGEVKMTDAPLTAVPERFSVEFGAMPVLVPIVQAANQVDYYVYFPFSNDHRGLYSYNFDDSSESSREPFALDNGGDYSYIFVFRLPSGQIGTSASLSFSGLQYMRGELKPSMKVPYLKKQLFGTGPQILPLKEMSSTATSNLVPGLLIPPYSSTATYDPSTATAVDVTNRVYRFQGLPAIHLPTTDLDLTLLQNGHPAHLLSPALFPLEFDMLQGSNFSGGITRPFVGASNLLGTSDIAVLLYDPGSTNGLLDALTLKITQSPLSVSNTATVPNFVILGQPAVTTIPTSAAMTATPAPQGLLSYKDGPPPAATSADRMSFLDSANLAYAADPSVTPGSVVTGDLGYFSVRYAREYYGVYDPTRLADTDTSKARAPDIYPVTRILNSGDKIGSDGQRWYYYGKGALPDAKVASAISPVKTGTLTFLYEYPDAGTQYLYFSQMLLTPTFGITGPSTDLIMRTYRISESEFISKFLKQ